jgi:formylglycine-generating enzyme required for sulfatase activity
MNGTTYKNGEGFNVTQNAGSNGYRLPNEKEWEWVARGGVKTRGYTYSGSNDLKVVAWTSENSIDGTKAVGVKAANELGIFDMSGNVWEWCWDIYLDTSDRVFRGGSWNDGAEGADLSRRGSYYPADRRSSFGFRLARNAGN